MTEQNTDIILTSHSTNTKIFAASMERGHNWGRKLCYWMVVVPNSKRFRQKSIQEKQWFTRPPWGCESMRVGLWELEVVLPCPEKLFSTYNSQINGVSASFLIDTGTAISLQYTVKKLLVTHQEIFFSFYRHHFLLFSIIMIQWEGTLWHCLSVCISLKSQD